MAMTAEDAEALARHAAGVRDARSILERIPTDQVFELPGRPHVCFQVGKSLLRCGHIDRHWLTNASCVQWTCRASMHTISLDHAWRRS